MKTLLLDFGIAARSFRGRANCSAAAPSPTVVLSPRVAFYARVVSSPRLVSIARVVSSPRCASLPLVAFGSLCAATAAAQGGSAYFARLHPVAGEARALAKGDFDGDGKLDLATTCGAPLPAQNAVGVLLGDGAGGLATVATFTASAFAFDIASGDLDSDGALDVVTCGGDSFGQGDITTLVGDGAGGFASSSPYLVGNSPYALALGDLDGDGALDAVVANFGSSNLSVRRGDGQGGLLDHAAYATAGYLPTTVELADVDLDGRLDAVSATMFPGQPSRLALLRGDGGGALLAPTVFALSLELSCCGDLALGDLDADGALDAVATSSSKSGATRVLGDGAGGFGAPLTVATGSGSMLSGVLGDLDGDGDLDLLGAVFDPPRIAIAYGDGTGALAAATKWPLGGSPAAAALGDWDADGVLDVAVGLTEPHAVTIARGLGAAGIALPPHVSTPGMQPRSGAVGDLDGDGHPELVVAGSWIGVLHGASGGFGAFVSEFMSSADAVALGDFDLDGRTDAVTVVTLAGAVQLRLGNGQGAFGAASTSSAGFKPQDVAVADLDGDGSPDALSANLDHQLALLLGDGAGGLGTPILYGSGPLPSVLVLGDLDLDGDVDACTASDYSGLVSVMLGDGVGGFGPAVHHDSGGVAFTKPAGLALGDLDRNGTLDAVRGASTGVRMLPGVGNGALGAPIAIAAPFACERVRCADLDADGALDLYGMSYQQATLNVLRGDGNGGIGFASAHQAVGVSRLGGIAFDWSGDGRLDVAVFGSSAIGGLTLFTNQLAAPPGLTPYGSGTPGCVGTHVLSASSKPAPGNAGFALTCTHAPAHAAGLAAIAGAPDFLGADIGLGVIVHLNVASPLIPLAITSDVSGVARAPIPIPALSGLVGAKFYAQSLWSWPASAACDPSTFGFSSSRGLTIQVQAAP